MKDVEPVKIAIVGCGAITGSQHLPAILRSPKLELVALVDNRHENAAELCHRYAIQPEIYDDLENAIDRVEGVLIATPNHTHYAIAKIALASGIPVLIEKPITTTYKDAVDLCQIAEKNNAFISVGYKTRYYPSVILLKRLLDQNYFGKILHFHYEFGSKGGWAPVSGYNISREKSGGGVLVVTGTHFLDRMLYWFGEPKSFSFYDDNCGGVEANCKAEMVFENEQGEFTGSFLLSKSVKLKNTFIIDTEKFICELGESDYEKITSFPKSDPEVKVELSPHQSNHGSKNYFQIQVEEFAENIRKRGHITVDGWFAARSMRLIEAMYSNRQQFQENWRVY